MGQNISQCLMVKHSWFAMTHGCLHSNAAFFSKSISNSTFFSMGKNSTNCHTLSQTLELLHSCCLSPTSPQELSATDIKLESLYFGIASTATLGTSYFTSSSKSLQLWQAWTRLTINLTFSRFVFYFLDSSLPRKLSKQILGENCKQNMLDLVTSLCQEKKKSVCLGLFYGSNSIANIPVD